MPQCNACMADIDADDETHLVVVKPMEWKGDTRKVRHYYCSVGCLIDQVQESGASD